MTDWTARINGLMEPYPNRPPIAPDPQQAVYQSRSQADRDQELREWAARRDTALTVSSISASVGSTNDTGTT